jgi:hypothetical protein
LCLFVTLAGGCASSIYDETCSAYDNRPESIQQRVISRMHDIPSLQVIACESQPSSSPGDDEACLVSIAPEDSDKGLMGWFGPERKSSERRPYVSVPWALAEQHGVTLEWLRGDESAGVFINAARDRVVIYRLEKDRCMSIAEII